jgi:hypothetical protein
MANVVDDDDVDFRYVVHEDPRLVHRDFREQPVRIGRRQACGPRPFFGRFVRIEYAGTRQIPT